MKDDDVVRKIKLQKFYFYHFIFLISLLILSFFGSVVSGSEFFLC